MAHWCSYAAKVRMRFSPKPTAPPNKTCLLYTSDAADERSSVDLGGRRIIKKKTIGATRTASVDEHASKSDYCFNSADY